MLRFLGIASVNVLPSLSTVLKCCCQTILAHSNLESDSDVLRQANPYLITSSICPVDVDFELELFFEVSEQTASQLVLRRPSKMRRVSRHKKSKGFAALFPPNNQR